MKMNKCDVYIGSDNGSKSVDDNCLDKVLQWAKSVFPGGYTMTKGHGYFGGSQEDSLILSVLVEHSADLYLSVKRLKSELQQKQIIITESEVEVSVI